MRWFDDCGGNKKGEGPFSAFGLFVQKEGWGVMMKPPRGVSRKRGVQRAQGGGRGAEGGMGKGGRVSREGGGKSVRWGLGQRETLTLLSLGRSPRNDCSSSPLNPDATSKTPLRCLTRGPTLTVEDGHTMRNQKIKKYIFFWQEMGKSGVKIGCNASVRHGTQNPLSFKNLKQNCPFPGGWCWGHGTVKGDAIEPVTFRFHIHGPLGLRLRVAVRRDCGYIFII